MNRQVVFGVRHFGAKEAEKLVEELEKLGLKPGTVIALEGITTGINLAKYDIAQVRKNLMQATAALRKIHPLAPEHVSLKIQRSLSKLSFFTY
ncbi:MAG TPA: hypothetical protein VJH23_05520 [archaeon]|nr:hypothetical protein [archaeon]